MLDIIRQLQCYMFVQASDIKPTPILVKQLLDVFSDKELLPSNFSEISGQNVQKRLKFSTINNEWNIFFGSDRFIIENNPIQDDLNLDYVINFTNEVQSYIGKIFDVLNKKANRLSFISKSILHEMSFSEQERIAKILFNYPKFYQEKIPFEWNYRLASKHDFNYGSTDETNETLNVITEVHRRRYIVEVEPTDRIGILFDINTIPDNVEYRLDKKSCIEYFSKIGLFHNDLFSSLEDFINE